MVKLKMNQKSILQSAIEECVLDIIKNRDKKDIGNMNNNLTICCILL
ncbi:MAG: hypothetical protein CM15mV96_050 [uncultured marine virus]|nr:MAG: hypothetical protein CM15mV96_050 [uncultured marine virus]